MTPVLMPQVGENLTTGVLLEWCKAEGDPVSRGDVIAVVESEKAAFEVTAHEDGVLLKLGCAAGDEAEVLTPIAWIGQPGESVEEDDGTGEPTAPAPSRTAAIAPGARPPGATLGIGRPGATPGHASQPSRSPASPSARRLSHQLLVDLKQVRGSGPGGRVVRRDVLAAALTACGGVPVASTTVALVVESGDRTVPFARLRKAVAERMSLSARQIPHFYLFADVDVTEAQAVRSQAPEEPAISLTDWIVAASAHALRRHERLNAHVADGGVVLKAGCHIGLAVAVDDGVLVPGLADADRKPLSALAEARHALIESARRGVVSPDPAPTFTVTNLGGHGVDRFLPLISPPECGILAVGRSQQRVVARDGEPVVREVVTVCLACDHRAVDGAYAAGFLDDFRHLLERPQDLLHATGRD